MRRRIVRYALGMLTFALLVSGAWAVWPRPRPLLERATVSLDAHDWFAHAESTAFRWSVGPHWIGDDELLFSWWSGEDRRLFRRNVRTGAETELKALTRIMDEFGGEHVSTTLSPDGRWLIEQERWGPTFVTDLDGSHHYEIPNQDGDAYRNAYWEDARHWVEVASPRSNGGDHIVRFRDVTSPRPICTLSRKENDLALTGRCDALMPGKIVSVSLPDWDVMSPPPVLDQVTVREVAWDQAGPPSRERQVRLPPGRQFRYAVLNPRHGVAAWLLRREAQEWPRGLHWMSRFWPRRSEAQDEVWASRMDGGDMRLVGAMPVKDDEDFGGWPYSVEWLPGGKSLSLLHEDRFYIVPVE